MKEKRYKKFEMIMFEAIKNAKKAKKEFEMARKSEDVDTFQFLNLQAQRSLGYAEGIFHCLSLFKFKHEGMDELRDLL